MTASVMTAMRAVMPLTSWVDCPSIVRGRR